LYALEAAMPGVDKLREQREEALNGVVREVGELKRATKAVDATAAGERIMQHVEKAIEVTAIFEREGVS
jgi:hypothetical protein